MKAVLFFSILFCFLNITLAAEPEKVIPPAATPTAPTATPPTPAPAVVEKAAWAEQKGYSMRPFAGLGGAVMAPVTNAKLGTGAGIHLEIGLLNEFKVGDTRFFRLRPAINLRNYSYEMGSTKFSYYTSFLRLGLGGKKELSRRWALFLDLNPQVALGRGYCADETGDTDTYQDSEWDWDDWDFTRDENVGTYSTTAFDADRDRVCGDFSRNLKMFQLGMRVGATLRLSNRILLEGFFESEGQANDSKLLKGSSGALGVLFNFIAF